MTDPMHLNPSEADEAEELFGVGPTAATMYANYANRRRIVRHYIFTHPATLRLQLGLYRFSRDLNPLYFALERGWQVGSGKEMFSREDRSRLGAAGDFLAALALMKSADVGLGTAHAPRMAIPTASDFISGKVVEIDPANLRWSQTTAGGRGRAGAIRSSMAENGWAGEPIDVVVTKDGLVTVDHTRAAVALEQGIKKIPVRLHMAADPLPHDMLTRAWNRSGQTAETWGEAVRLRGEGQDPPIGPTGTSKPPMLPNPKNTQAE